VVVAAIRAAAPAAGATPPSVRKVRTAQGTVLDNVKAAQADGKCNRKKPLGGGLLIVSCWLLVFKSSSQQLTTSNLPSSKGEMVW
jgi:hypothetical protein